MKESRIFIKQNFINVDWQLMLYVALLITLGLFFIYSAGGRYETSKYVVIQSGACCMGIFAVFILSCFDYKYYRYFDKFVYGISLALLGSVLILGSVKKGTRGWFDFGIISFQPVEIAKIMYILVVASFLDKRVAQSKKIHWVIGSACFLLGHLALIMQQPDFSSTISYFPVTLVLLFMAGVETFYLVCVIICGCLATGFPLLETFFKLQGQISPANDLFDKLFFYFQNIWLKIYFVGSLMAIIMSLWYFLKKIGARVSILYPMLICCSVLLGTLASIPIDKSLKEYQRKRLIVFLNPDIDKKSSGYNIIQSKIAIGSGKIAGRGFKKGTQTQLGYLPEQHTDFIFSLISEEGGWVIAQVMLLLYVLFIWRIIKISQNAKNRYGSLVAMGIATMFVFYAFVNVGMVMGLMPVTGMPLPFISYGGSSVFSSLCAVGILLSINKRKNSFA
jgi:rod shape determining protein RodA